MTTPDTAVTPLALEQIPCSAEYYGVKVSALGEDGDEGWVAFTHDERRAIAALHRYIRDDLASGPVKEITTDQPRWWVVVDNCGCGDTCPHEPDSEDDVWHEDCVNYGLAPCIEEELSWLGTYCDASTPGAVPVIRMEASY
jgi:hypothetical protein